jgi:uncharacterized CHY-type Zn-finger protein
LIIAGHDIQEEFILCKQCGNEIAYLKDIHYKKSPYALKTWNDSSLFHMHVPTIQQFRNPNGIHFDLITVTKADLYFLNETKSIQDTWFPNFYWTISLCPKCKTHLGWYFDSVSGENFFTIILSKVFNEEYANSIVLQPKLRMY